MPIAAPDHPLTPVLEAVRKIILASNKDITEGFKWNSHSYSTTSTFKDFATASIYQRAKVTDCVMIIFHQGSKVQANRPQPTIADPQGLLQWLAKDRCTVKFHTLAEVKARKSALQAIIREWMAEV